MIAIGIGSVFTWDLMRL